MNIARIKELGCLSSLGMYSVKKYNLTRNEKDFNSGISPTEKTIEIAPEDCFPRVGMLANPGILHMRSSDKTHHSEALTAFSRGWNYKGGSPVRRMIATTNSIQTLIQRQHYYRVVELALRGLSHLVSFRSLSTLDQQEILLRFSGLAGKACAIFAANRKGPWKRVLSCWNKAEAACGSYEVQAESAFCTIS